MDGEARNLAIVAMFAIAPIALVVIVALLRGYSIHLSLTRDKKE
jgi:hypothetical protein